MAAPPSVDVSMEANVTTAVVLSLTFEQFDGFLSLLFFFLRFLCRSEST
jgi:hypothetical protein